MDWKSMFTFSFWQTSFLGNTLDTYLLSVGVFLAMIAGCYILKRFVLRRVALWSKRTKNQWDDALVQAFRGIGNGFYGYISLYVAVQFLILPENIRQILYWGLMVLIIFRTTHALQVFLDFLARKHMQGGKASRPAISLVSTLLRICVWVVVLMVVLSNLGVNVTSLATGLGIGGIAVALAAQNILSDLFSYFTLHFDKPVKEGDTIMFENTLGTVEKIGLKTTRIKTQRGEQMVVPNKDVTAKLLFNFEHLKERRELFTLGITYQTSTKQLKKIPEKIKDIITKIEHTRFDRAHLSRFGDFAIEFEIVYHIESPEYLVYRDCHQAVLMGIREYFEKEGIAFAYPTQTVYLEK